MEIEYGHGWRIFATEAREGNEEGRGFGPALLRNPIATEGRRNTLNTRMGRAGLEPGGEWIFSQKVTLGTKKRFVTRRVRMRGSAQFYVSARMFKEQIQPQIRPGTSHSLLF